MTLKMNKDCMDMDINKINNIKQLYGQLKHGTKTSFIELVAFDLVKSPLTIHNHWFARFWQVPEEHQDRVIELLQNTLKLQNQTKTI